MIGDAIAEALLKAMILVAVASAGATAALIFGVPWLWGLLKPWLHSVTG